MAAVAPRAALRRQVARQALRVLDGDRRRLTPRAGYDGARTDRKRGDRWSPTRVAPDDELREDLGYLRERSRELAKDHAIGGAIDSRVTHTVGTGPRPLATVQPLEGLITEAEADAFNAAAETIYEAWAGEACADRASSLWQLLGLVDRTLAVDGEAFVLLSDSADGGPVPLAAELVAAERIETPPQLESSPRVRLGVEYTSERRTRRAAYWIRDTHPGDALHAKQTYTRVDASRVLHCYEPWFSEQSRGLPWLTRTLALLRDVHDLDEAMVLAAQVEACFAAFVKREGMAPPEFAAAASSDTTASGRRLQDIQPATISYLAPEESIEFAQPTRPGGTYEPFQRWNHRRIAAALNWAYPLLVKDWGGISFAGGRLVLAELRLQIQRWQQLEAERVGAPLWRALIDRGVLLGLLPVDPRRYQAQRWLWTRHAWIQPAWPYAITPAEEVKADVEAVAANLKTKREAIAARGGEISEVYAERAWEEREERRLGIKPAEPGAAAAAEPSEASSSAETDDDQADEETTA